MTIKVTRAGWFNFEGFGRPFEGWFAIKRGRWQTAGRALTRRGARRKAVRAALAGYANPPPGAERQK